MYRNRNGNCEFSRYNIIEKELPTLDDVVDDAFANLSLMTSSANTSTHTLHEQEKTTPSTNRNSSVGSIPDSDQAEEIAQLVQSKVEAGRSINRFVL